LGCGGPARRQQQNESKTQLQILRHARPVGDEGCESSRSGRSLYRPACITRRRDLADITDRRDSADMIDHALPADAIENTDATDPIEPIERNEPTEPIDNMLPFDPIDRNESSDHSERSEFFERATSRPYCGVNPSQVAPRRS
jgi:hypothetical protein